MANKKARKKGAMIDCPKCNKYPNPMMLTMVNPKVAINGRLRNFDIKFVGISVGFEFNAACRFEFNTKMCNLWFQTTNALMLNVSIKIDAHKE